MRASSTRSIQANVVRAETIRDSDASAPDKLRTLIESLMESYAAHYPFLYVFGHWLWSKKPSVGVTWAASTAMIVFLVAFAWAALRLYDAPVRIWLAARGRKAAVAAAE